MTPEIGCRKSIVYWGCSARQNDIFRNSVKMNHIGLEGPKNGNHVLVMTPEIGRRRSIVYWASSARQNDIFRNSVKMAHIGLEGPKNGGQQQGVAK